MLGLAWFITVNLENHPVSLFQQAIWVIPLHASLQNQMGFPIQKVLFATNSNRTIYNFSKTGEWTPSSSIPTFASAMDVGNPSNMERFFSLYHDDKTQSRDGLYFCE